MPRVSHTPSGHHSLTPYLIVDGCAAAIDFYKNAFGGIELFRLPGPDGKLGHAELQIGDSIVMLADEQPEMGEHGPHRVGGSPVGILVYLPDVDAAVRRAVEGGGKLVRAVTDQFYGDRMGTVVDPFGHVWHIATHIEDVPPEEVARRAAALAKGG